MREEFGQRGDTLVGDCVAAEGSLQQGLVALQELHERLEGLALELIGGQVQVLDRRVLLEAL